jgi:hypothetical protein
MQAFPRILTFFNLFFQWILFLPIVAHSEEQIRDCHARAEGKYLGHRCMD